MINTRIHFEYGNKQSKIKILFILKERFAYGISYGLINSCIFIANKLKDFDIEVRIVTVVDGHDIDRVVSNYKPTHVIIEAIWCPAEKFPVLIKLHPNVKWIVRLHSNLPFLVQEGHAIDTLNKYNDIAKIYSNNFYIAGNNQKLINELKVIGLNLAYLPNYYPIVSLEPNTNPIDKTINIGCFGATRVLKNQCEQALAAIMASDSIEKELRFHINSSQFETIENMILKNLRNIFKNIPHKLIEHEWTTHEDFIKLVKQMDIGMQVSMTETFCIVGADFVANGIPLIGSKEVEFLSHQYQADPTNIKDINNKLRFAISHKTLGTHKINQIKLSSQVEHAINTWLNYLN